MGCKCLKTKESRLVRGLLKYSLRAMTQKFRERMGETNIMKFTTKILMVLTVLAAISAPAFAAQDSDDALSKDCVKSSTVSDKAAPSAGSAAQGPKGAASTDSNPPQSN